MDFNETSRIWSFKSGLDVRLINEMSKYFNFSMKIIECYSDWGIQLPNKTWSGIIGKIVSKVHFTYMPIICHTVSENVFLVFLCNIITTKG